MAVGLAGGWAPRRVQARGPRRSSGLQAGGASLRAVGKRASSDDGRRARRRVGSSLRASAWAAPLVRLAGGWAAPSRCWQARIERRWPSGWQAGGLLAACKRVGRAARPAGKRVGCPFALLASAHRATMAVGLAGGWAPCCVQARGPRRSSGWQAGGLPLRAVGKRASSDDGRRAGRRVGSSLRASAWAAPLVRLASGWAAPSRCWQARIERRWSSGWQAGGLLAACKRVGRAARPAGRRVGCPFALLASAHGCGPRPLGRRQGPPRAKRAPASARASEGGEVWRRRAASEAAQGASVASDRVDPATWCPTDGLACRPPGLGFGRSSGQARFGRARARWRRSRSSGADVRRVDESLSRAARCRRRALRAVDGSSRRARGASSTRDSADRRSAHCPERGAEPKTRRTTGRPDSRAPRRRIYAVVASLLPAPLRKRRDGAIPRLLRRLVLTPRLASLAAGPDGGPRAAARIHPRLPTARRGGPPACQPDERRGQPACQQPRANPPASRTPPLAHGSTNRRALIARDELRHSRFLNSV